MCSNCTISEYVDAYNNCLPGPIYIIQNAYLFKLQRTTNLLLYYIYMLHEYMYILKRIRPDFSNKFLGNFHEDSIINVYEVSTKVKKK